MEMRGAVFLFYKGGKQIDFYFNKSRDIKAEL